MHIYQQNGGGVQHQTTPALAAKDAEIARLRAEVEGLRKVLKKAWEDVNWMTNEGTLLNRECFGYLDAAMGASA